MKAGESWAERNDCFLLAAIGLRCCAYVNKGPLTDRAAFQDASDALLTAWRFGEWSDDTSDAIEEARALSELINPGWWPAIPPAWKDQIGLEPDLTLFVQIGQTWLHQQLRQNGRMLPTELGVAFIRLDGACASRLDQLRWMNGNTVQEDCEGIDWQDSAANPKTLPDLFQACTVFGAILVECPAAQVLLHHVTGAQHD